MTTISTLPSGYRALVLEEIDSTNEEAKRQAEAGAPGGLFILARVQTAGRGRRGRDWASLKGNLHATLLLRPQVTPRKSTELSFVAANAVAETFDALGALHIEVKWPNDVLIAGAKAAGILLESVARDAARVDWLAVGIGINLKTAPEGTSFPATALAHHIGHAPPEPEAVLPILAQAWARAYETWSKDGFASVRRAWLARAAGLGERIVARLETGEMEGDFLDLSETGELIVETAQGRRAISAGEVFFARTT